MVVFTHRTYFGIYSFLYPYFDKSFSSISRKVGNDCVVPNSTEKEPVGMRMQTWATTDIAGRVHLHVSHVELM